SMRYPLYSTLFLKLGDSCIDFCFQALISFGGAAQYEPTKSEHMTFVLFIIGLRGNVILSAAKNLSERPFVSLRVTTLVYQSFAILFSSAAMFQLLPLRQWEGQCEATEPQYLPDCAHTPGGG